MSLQIGMKFFGKALLATLVAAPVANVALAQAAPAVEPQAGSTAGTQEKPYEANWRLFGVFLPQFVYADDAALSFGSRNIGAPSDAAHNTPDNDRARMQFQAHQSRLGAEYKPAPNVRGKFLVDWYNPALAQPAVQSYPRLKVAKVEYDGPGDITWFMGQDYEAFAPLQPFSYSPVGGQYRTGNVGWTRTGFGGTYKGVPGWEFLASLGNVSPDANANDSAVEWDPSISGTLLIQKVGPGFRAGLAGFYANRAYDAAFIANRYVYALDAQSYGAAAHLESLGDVWEIKSELFWGNDLANANMLTIGLGRGSTPTSPQNLREYGGWVSARYKMEGMSVFGGYGLDQIINSGDITAATHGSAGIRKNQQFRVGVDKNLAEKTRAFLELAKIETSYYDDGVDDVNFAITGMMIQF